MSEAREGGGRAASGRLERLTFLVGPTAIGKTAVGIALAPHLGAEILAVDARQIYRHLDLGTAKPTQDEREAAPHHLIDLYEPTERVSAARFALRFHAVRRALLERGVGGLAVGGSGLYVDACLGRLDAMPPADDAIRRRHAALREVAGPGELHDRLRQVDPAAAQRIARGDYKRVSRALEVHELTGVPLSVHQQRRGPLDLAQLAPMLLLVRSRDDLYARIAARADAMLAAGLLREIADLLQRGIPADCPAFESIGYADFVPALRGETTVAEAREAFVRRTRRYAKRQLTWFRNRYRGVREVMVEPGELPAHTAARCLAALAGG